MSWRPRTGEAREKMKMKISEAEIGGKKMVDRPPTHYTYCLHYEPRVISNNNGKRRETG